LIVLPAISTGSPPKDYRDVRPKYWPFGCHATRCHLLPFRPKGRESYVRA